MLYPGYADDPAYHADTVLALAGRTDIDCFDCCLPIEPGHRRRAAVGLRDCTKQITYVNHLFPAQKLSLGSADFAVGHIVREFLKGEVEIAAEIGADSFLFVSGADVPEDQEGALERFGELTVWLCELLAERGMTGLLEPLDTGLDKRFLIGSTERSVRFVQGLNLPNLKLEVDMGHLPCLFEDFETSYRLAAPHLGRVHLSNCVLRNPRDRFFGDRHPSFFHPGGQLGQSELTRVLRVLRDIGFIGENAGHMVFEVNPLDGEDAERTVGSHLSRFKRALEQIHSLSQPSADSSL
jgi:sugar phosphate isomerase/epimerase